MIFTLYGKDGCAILHDLEEELRKPGDFRFITHSKLNDIHDIAEDLKLPELEAIANEVVYQRSIVISTARDMAEHGKRKFWRGVAIGIAFGVVIALAGVMLGRYNDKVERDERAKVTAIEEAGRATAEAQAAEERRFIYVGRGAYTVNDSGVHRRGDTPSGASQDRTSGVRSE